MIGISADFDPVHLGHVKLIDKARELADKKNEDVVIYLNKGFSANHAPFFVSYDARRRMALEAGADEVVPIEGLHHRLTLAYTVPIRIAMMIEDGVVDYVDAADVSTSRIKKYASDFSRKGIFSGIPRSLPNRNVIRWFAVNDFLKKKYGKNLKFHIIPEHKIKGEKISGRMIRREILENNMKIPEEVKKLLPDSTVRILEKEIKKGTIPGRRNIRDLTKRLNTYSRANLSNMAHMNADAVNSIVAGRSYRNEDKGIIPPDMTVDQVIQRAWYVSSMSSKGISASEAHKKFRNGVKSSEKRLNHFDAGMHLRSFETESLKPDMDAMFYVDKNERLCCEIRAEDRKIKSPLRLPAHHVTYLRLLIDSHFIPITGKLIEKPEGWRVRISVGD